MPRLSLLSAAFAVLCPAATFAADAPRSLRVEPGVRAEPIDGPVTVERVTRPSGVVVEKLAGRHYRVVDSEGVVLSRSFPVIPAPRRIEERVYYRPDRPAHRLNQLYGGFYGLDRWGVGREDE